MVNIDEIDRASSVAAAAVPAVRGRCGLMARRETGALWTDASIAMTLRVRQGTPTVHGFAPIGDLVAAPGSPPRSRPL